MSFQEGCETALGVALVVFFDADFLAADFLVLDEEAGRVSIGGGDMEVLEDIVKNRKIEKSCSSRRYVATGQSLRRGGRQKLGLGR